MKQNIIYFLSLTSFINTIGAGVIKNTVSIYIYTFFFFIKERFFFFI